MTLWWLISLGIAAVIIYFLLVSRGEERTAGVDRGDVMVTTGRGDEEVGDELASGVREELWDDDEDEEFAELDAERGLRYGQGDDEEFGTELGERYDNEFAEEFGREEYNEFDDDFEEEYGEEFGIGDGVGYGRDFRRVDEEYGKEVAPKEETLAGGFEEGFHEQEEVDNIVARDRKLGFEPDPNLISGNQGVKSLNYEAAARIARMEDEDLDERFGVELFNGDELGGIRANDVIEKGNEDHDEDDVPMGSKSRMERFEDQTYMNERDVVRETRSGRKRARGRDKRDR